MSRRGDAGFSLVEVLTGMTMFAVMAAAMTKGMASTVRTNALSKEAVAAAALVQDQIEKFRAIDPTTNSALLTAGTHVDANSPVTALGAAGGDFTRLWTVIANTPSTGLSEVIVAVSWKNKGIQRLTGVTYVCSSSTCS